MSHDSVLASGLPSKPELERSQAGLEIRSLQLAAPSLQKLEQGQGQSGLLLKLPGTSARSSQTTTIPTDLAAASAQRGYAFPPYEE